MRQLSLTILPIVLVIGTLCMAHAEQQIQWAPDLEQARVAASQQNKLLLIHFWAPDCAPCKVVDRKVFPLPTVARAINDNFVALKVNANENPALRDHFGVQRWPTDIISTVDGIALHEMVTDQNPNRYIHKLVSIASQQTSKTFANLANDPQPGSRTQLPSEGHWANGVHPPEITQSTAVARRPGLDPSLAPGVGITSPSHSMSESSPESMLPKPSRFDRPPSDPTYAQFANPSAASQRSAAARSPLPHPSQSTFSSEHQSPAETAEASRQHAVINNRFASTTSAAQSMPNRRSTEQQIDNPYFAANQTVNQAPPARDVRSTAAPSLEPSSDVASSGYPIRERSKDLETGTTANTAPELGLDGRCPVTLISKGRWRKGNVRWGAIHRGKTYLFAGPDEQRIFLANPDDFSPALAGMDVVRLADHGLVVEGTRRFGVLYDDDGTGSNRSRIYLFDSEQTRNRFESAPEQFLAPIMQAMQSGTLDMLLR